MSTNSAVLLAALIGGGLGIFGAVCGALAAHFVQRWNKRRETLDEAILEVHHYLLA